MPVWLLGMSRFSKEEDRMAKIMLVMTHEEVDTNIAYSLICFSRYGSAWDTGRRRRRGWQTSPRRSAVRPVGCSNRRVAGPLAEAFPIRSR